MTMVTEFIQFANQRDFEAFEKKMQRLLVLPRIGRRASDGVAQPNKQQTVFYSRAINHPNKDSPTPDNRIITPIDNRADKEKQTVIDENTAKSRGWFDNLENEEVTK